MKPSRKPVVRKKRGRPATGQDPVTAIRLSADMRERADKWAAGEPDKPVRSEAIRRLMELGLASTQPAGPSGKKAAYKASKLARREIDRLGTSPQPTTNGKVGSSDSSKGRRSFATFAAIPRRQRASEWPMTFTAQE